MHTYAYASISTNAYTVYSFTHTYACMHISMHAHIRMPTYACMHISRLTTAHTYQYTYTQTHAHTHKYVHINTNTPPHIHTYPCTNTHTNKHTHTFTCIQIITQIHTYKSSHTHTHTHTHLPQYMFLLVVPGSIYFLPVESRIWLIYWTWWRWN